MSATACQQVLRNALQLLDQAPVRLRQKGTEVNSQSFLMGPLPKGSIPALTVNNGARMAALRRHMHNVCRTELQTKDVRFVGRYDKDRCSPMLLYMEFASIDAARNFGYTADHMVPPEFGRLMGPGRSDGEPLERKGSRDTLLDF